jgi:hypothetical protein
MEEQPIGGDARFGCYLIADSSPYSDIARSVECRVFEEFFGNDPSIMLESYGPYERHSKFLLMIDRELRQPAGVIRIIEHSAVGLKTFNDIEGAPLWISTEEATAIHQIDLAKTWDIGSLAVLKEYRGGSTKHFVCTLLYGQLYLEVCKAGIEHLTAILDEHAFRQLIDKYGVPFVPIAGSGAFSYLGSERNYAAYASVSWIGPGVEACMKNKAELRARRMSSPDLEIAIYGKGLATPVEVG